MDERVFRLERRVDELEKSVKDAAELMLEQDRRVDRVERSQAAVDLAISVFRWAGPIAVGIAALIVGHYS